MAEIFASTGSSLLGVEEVPREQTQSYGIVTIDKMQGDTARIHSIVEKPKPAEAPSNLAVIGRYVLTPRIFELLGEVVPGAGGEIQLTDAISALLAHERVLAVRLPGTALRLRLEARLPAGDAGVRAAPSGDRRGVRALPEVAEKMPDTARRPGPSSRTPT